MLNGIIFVSEGIISLDLQNILSKHYKIVNSFKNAGPLSPNNNQEADFFIIDPDLYSIEDLKNILIKLHLNPEVKIIALTSQPEENLRKSFHCKHVIAKPFDHKLLFQAIEN